MDKVTNTSFEQEKQSSTWNKFLYDLAVTDLSADIISSSLYDDHAFGSWVVESIGKRLVYEGRDHALRFEIYVNSEWETKEEIAKKDLSYEILKEFIVLL
jgi:hypothetical protein